MHTERTIVQGRGAAPRVAPEATLEEHSGTIAWNGHFTRVLSSSTVVDAAYSGFHGTQDLEPYNGVTPGWYDIAADYYSVNSYYSDDAGRDRQQVQGTVNRLTGAHDLSLGGVFNAGSAQTTYGYPGGRSIDAVSGVPLFVYLWDGSNKSDVTRTYAVYGQDSWRVRSNLTINAGARFERSSGTNTDANGTAYSDQLDRAAYRPGLGPARRRKDGSPRPLRVVLRRGAFGRLRRRRPGHRAALWCERRSLGSTSPVRCQFFDPAPITPSRQRCRRRARVKRSQASSTGSSSPWTSPYTQSSAEAIDTSTTCCKLVRVVS